MQYDEVLKNARKTILNCKACPECNGLACGNTLPGPGSKAPGNGANDNWRAWKAIKLNVDTFVPDADVDTSFSLFGKTFRLPVLSGPIGSMMQYSKEDVTVDFNDAVIQACAEEGIIASFGDGIRGETMEGGFASIARHQYAGVIPILNPIPNDEIRKRIEYLEPSSAFAVSVVVDSAGLGHWKFNDRLRPGSKTVSDLKFLRSCTKKPFLVKGIMTAKAAEQAVEAGADGIIVSNHGGRVLADTPATAEVLPEIVHAVKGQTAIIVDGGIRNGTDLVKALALGADAVLICRPFAVAWFGGGVDGVKAYIEKIREEFSDAMYMVGARRLSDLCPEMIRLP
ncbi:MAG: alpha-hydroxy-acid oxidizing protein [Oscillospiraceae bacterium]|nr:alpha-hydroxy-acid oxidizing protein [Oscillospiraceae bacterium]